MTWRAPVHYVMDDEVSTGTLSYFRGVSGVDRVAGHRDRHAHTRSSHPREDASQHVRRCHRLGLAAVQAVRELEQALPHRVGERHFAGVQQRDVPHAPTQQTPRHAGWSLMTSTRTEIRA